MQSADTAHSLKVLRFQMNKHTTLYMYMYCMKVWQIYVKLGWDSHVIACVLVAKSLGILEWVAMTYLIWKHDGDLGK